MTGSAVLVTLSSRTCWSHHGTNSSTADLYVASSAWRKEQSKWTCGKQLANVTNTERRFVSKATGYVVNSWLTLLTQEDV